MQRLYYTIVFCFLSGILLVDLMAREFYGWEEALEVGGFLHFGGVSLRTLTGWLRKRYIRCSLTECEFCPQVYTGQ